MLLPYARNQNAHAWHRWWQTCHRNAYICPYRQFKTQSNKDEHKNTKRATGALKRDYNACKTIKPLLPKQRKIRVHGHISPEHQGHIRCLLSGGILDLQKCLLWITIISESKGVWVRGCGKPRLNPMRKHRQLGVSVHFASLYPRYHVGELLVHIIRATERPTESFDLI